MYAPTKPGTVLAGQVLLMVEGALITVVGLLNTTSVTSTSGLSGYASLASMLGFAIVFGNAAALIASGLLAGDPARKAPRIVGLVLNIQALPVVLLYLLIFSALSSESSFGASSLSTTVLAWSIGVLGLVVATIVLLGVSPSARDFYGGRAHTPASGQPPMAYAPGYGHTPPGASMQPYPAQPPVPLQWQAPYPPQHQHPAGPPPFAPFPGPRPVAPGEGYPQGPPQ